MVAVPALSTGSFFGIISITNVWLAAFRDDTGEWLRGMRGFGYTAALLVSLVGELARLQGLAFLPVPHVSGLPAEVPVPSAMTTELLAVLLIVLDPLIVRPLMRWVEDGAEHTSHAEQEPA
jgi:hypothetical protein